MQDEVFLTFVAIAAGVLTLAGCILAVLRFASGRDLSHAWLSYRSWLMMAPLFLAAVALGRTATIVFLTLLSLGAFKEFAKGTGLYRDWWMMAMVYLGVLGIGWTAWAEDPTEGRSGWLGMFLALPVYVVALILIVPILRDRVKGQLQAMALATIGFIYIGWMFGHLAFMVNSPNAYGYVMFLVLAVEVNDVAAYTCGRAFGKKALRANISPNKTVGGAVGALLVSLCLPFAFQFALVDFDTTELLLTGVIVGIGGQLGDLSISVIKRDLGVKDLGALIPGHGGILDRIDSLVFVAPVFFHMVHYYRGIYGATV